MFRSFPTVCRSGGTARWRVLSLFFRNRTEVTRLAQDLTGVQHIVGALRAYTHEFTNKLHVILGLLQLGEDKQAEEYVLHLTQTRAHSIGYISERIRDRSVAAR